MMNLPILTPLVLVAMLQADPALASAPSDLLEKAIYTEETVGDLSSAIKLYGEIINNADKNNAEVATAMYRQSVCYQLQGNSQKSTNLLTQLIKRYPEQAVTIKKAKSLLSELNTSALNLIPVPWADGEEHYYSLHLPNGSKVGAMTASSRSSTINNQDVWEFESSIVGGNQLYMKSFVNKENFYPISAESKSPQLGNASITFNTSNVTAHYVNKGKKVEKNTALEQPAFDASQMNNVIRRLPLSTNYSISTHMYYGLMNSLVKVDISVKGKETITISGIKYDCFKVNVIFTQGSIEIQNAIMWIADNNTRNVVKTEDNNSYAILNDVIINKATETTRTRIFEKYNFSLTTAKNRQAVDVSFKNKSVEIFLGLVKPDFKEPIMFAMITPQSDNGAAHLRIPKNKSQYHLDLLKSKVDTLSLRSDFSKEFRIAGVPAIGFVADIKKGNKEMVVAHAYFAKDGNLYNFSTEVEKTKFEQHFKEFKTMINTFKFL